MSAFISAASPEKKNGQKYQMYRKMESNSEFPIPINIMSEN